LCVCRQCGNELSGQQKSYCSPKCRGRFKARQRRLSGKAVGPETICAGCKKVFRPKSRGGGDKRGKGLYCTRECAWEHRPRQSGDRWTQAVSDGYLRWVSNWSECKWCGCMFVGKGSCCGCGCAWNLRVGEYRACIKCGSAINRREGLKKRTCSRCAAEASRAGRRRAKAKRRAYKKNNGPHDSISHREVFERDGWVCGICGRETIRAEWNVNDPDPRAATLDHIVALANGGTHTMSNVQCACFECNCVKADKWIRSITW
jgi:hypothetical protein